LHDINFTTGTRELDDGGKCSRCGFATDFIEVYDFHHPDPDKKDALFENRSRGGIMSWERYKQSIRDTVMLCANCHRIVHALLLKKVALGEGLAPSCLSAPV
jgi:predicted HNH restriction endonuclease